MDIYVQKDGQRQGPFPEGKIRQGIDAGEFVPADLAWTTGKASWQPISALINLDVNQPPPIHGEEVLANSSIRGIVGNTGSAEVMQVDEIPPIIRSLPSGEASSDPILYQNPPDFRSSLVFIRGKMVDTLSVVVTSGRLKIGSDSYSLHEVIEVKLNISKEQDSPAHWLNSKMLYRFLKVAACIGLFGFVVSYYTLLMLPVAVVLIYMGQKALDKEEMGLRWLAKLALNWPGKKEEIIIGAFLPYPDELLEKKMTRLGMYDVSAVAAWKENFIKNRQRSHDIVEAVGKAIERKSK